MGSTGGSYPDEPPEWDGTYQIVAGVCDGYIASVGGGGWGESEADLMALAPDLARDLIDARADLARAREEGRAEERAAVVAWLRQWADTARVLVASGRGCIAVVSVAEAVERGDHLPKPEEAP
jgi:hypothetical protein